MARKRASGSNVTARDDHDDDIQDMTEEHEPQQKVTTVLVRGKSALPATPGDNKRYGHWSGGDSSRNGEGAIHWPGDTMVEHRVSIAVLDRLKQDPNLSLSYDPNEEEMARANVAPDVQAQELALQAAEAELRAKELNAQAAAAAAQAAAAAAARAAEEQREIVNRLRNQPKP